MTLEERKKEFEEGQQFITIIRGVLNSPTKKKMSLALMEAFDSGYELGFTDGSQIKEKVHKEAR